VKERIAAPMTHDHPGKVLAAGYWQHRCGCASVEGKAVPADFSGVCRPLFSPGIVSENSVISETTISGTKQPFMKDFSASGFTIQRSLRRVIGAIAGCGV